MSRIFCSTKFSGLSNRCITISLFPYWKCFHLRLFKNRRMHITFCHVCGARNDLKVELSVQSKNRTERIWMHWENMSKSYHLWASHSAWCKETCVRRARLSYIIARWLLIAFRINFVSASEAERKANRHRLATSIVSSSRSFSSSSSPPPPFF